MITVGVRELKQKTSQLIRQVREDGDEIQVTYRGEVVALILPARRLGDDQSRVQAWADLDRLAAEIGARWPAGVSAAEALAEGRR